MTKLNDKQIKALETLKDEGKTTVFKMIRKYYSTWYVETFKIDELLKTKCLPSYWYRSSGITENQALKNGAVRMPLGIF